MKKIKTKVERYQYDENHILEVWEEVDPKWGLYWDFWITEPRCTYKLNCYSVIADQSKAKEPFIYTKKQAIEEVLEDMPEYIWQYEEEMERMEEEFCAEIEARKEKNNEKNG